MWGAVVLALVIFLIVVISLLIGFFLGATRNRNE